MATTAESTQGLEEKLVILMQEGAGGASRSLATMLPVNTSVPLPEHAAGYVRVGRLASDAEMMPASVIPTRSSHPRPIITPRHDDCQDCEA